MTDGKTYVAAPAAWGANAEQILSFYMEKRGLVTEDSSLWNANRQTAIDELTEFFSKFPECSPVKA